MHYLTGDIVARCSALSSKEEKLCEFSRLAETGECLYKRFDGVCDHPNAVGVVIKEKLFSWDMVEDI